MKVILIKDVAKIGRRFDVVTVPDGFALNKLIPKNLAQAATPENIKRLENQSQKAQKDREIDEASFHEALSKLKEVEVSIVVEANAEGRMFKALKADEVAHAVKEAIGYELQSECIVMKVPIKSVGEHEIELASGKVHGSMTLNVMAKGK